MRFHKYRHHWIILFALLTGLWGPGLPAADGADDGPPPPADDAPSAPAAPAVTVPTACLFGLKTAAANNINLPILDNTTITSSVTITTSFPFIWSIRLFTALTHTANSQLDLTLVSPAGTRVLLADKKGGANDNVYAGTEWRDENDQPVTDFTFTNNVTATHLSPQEPLGALRGENANGDWKLVIHDGFAGDKGVLKSWSVQINGLSHAPDVVTTTDIPMTGGGAIPDGVSLGFAVANVPSLPDPISAITLSTVITHMQPGSLQIFLAAPSGLTVTLSTGNGSSAANAFAGTLWDDRAARTDPLALVTTHHYVTGQLASPLAPEEPLSLVLGKKATGAWVLKVMDTVNDGKVGVIGPVVLHVQTAHCFPNLSAQAQTLFVSFPRLSQPAGLSLGASNTGVTATTTVSLTATLDPQMRFQSVVTGTWSSCSTPPVNSFGGDITCTRPSLGANSTERITATITAPALAGVTHYTVTVSSSLPDSDPSDNTRVQEFTAYAHSANGSPADVVLDTGAIDEGGQDAFDTWGQLRVAVFSGSSLLSDTTDLDFGLVFSLPGQRWATTTPASVGGVQLSRQILAPPDQDWVRYVDTFQNLSGAPRDLLVDWGGNLGSDTDTYVQASSSGDAVITASDTWAVTQETAPPAAASDSPVGYVLRSPGDSSYLGPVISSDPLITTTWPLSENDDLSHLFTFSLAPGQTRRLAYFVYRGLAEDTPGPVDCAFYGGCVTPAVGAEVALADSTVSALVLAPPLCDLSFAERASLVNWPGLAVACRDLFLPTLTR